jgi:hypothetical protein
MKKRQSWKDEYPPTSALNADEAHEIETKWGSVLRARAAKTSVSKAQHKR